MKCLPRWKSDVPEQLLHAVLHHQRDYGGGQQTFAPWLSLPASLLPDTSLLGGVFVPVRAFIWGKYLHLTADDCGQLVRLRPQLDFAAVPLSTMLVGFSFNWGDTPGHVKPLGNTYELVLCLLNCGWYLIRWKALVLCSTGFHQSSPYPQK